MEVACRNYWLELPKREIGNDAVQEPLAANNLVVGVAFLIQKDLTKRVTFFESISNRIALLNILSPKDPLTL